MLLKLPLILSPQNSVSPLLKPPLLAFATGVLALKTTQQESITALSQAAHL